MKNLFPTNMMNKELSCEEIASKLSNFYEQIHLLHLQTKSYAEHMALGGFYEFLGGFKDDVLEKIMGYKGLRLNSYSLGTLRTYTPGMSAVVVGEVKDFAEQLSAYAIEYNMPSVDDVSQDLSGQAAKTLYLLTLT